MKGLGMGKKLGAPTVNINPRRAPAGFIFGVYAAKVKIGSKIFDGVMHYGSRFVHDGEVSLEVHLFDLEKNLYGERIEVEVIKRIRDIKKFRSGALLNAQIKRDIAKAKKLL